MVTIEEVRAALRAAKLDQLVEYAERLVLPAIRITAKGTNESEIPLGVSKIGGRPDLPADTAWPLRNDTPLGFLAQLNLGEVAEFDVEHALPPMGMLHFFYDFANERCGVYPEDRDAWQVLYVNDGPDLSRSTWPASLPQGRRLRESLIEFSTISTITQEPDWVASELASDDERERFHRVDERFFRPFPDGTEEEMEAHDFVYRATKHQLLGHPFLVHYGTMPHVCESLVNGRPNPLFTLERVLLDEQPYESWNEAIKAELASAYEHWRLLFQLGNVSGLPFPRASDSDGHPLRHTCDLWARGGLMCFWIERNRMAQRDFSRVWMLGASQY